jgi:hypothetical protein
MGYSKVSAALHGCYPIATFSLLAAAFFGSPGL